MRINGLLALGLAPVLSSCSLFIDSTGTARVHGSKPVHSERPAIVSGEPVISILAVGDAGTGNIHQHRVANGMSRVAREHMPAAILYLGDNFYGYGVSSITDPQWKTAFTDVYRDSLLPVPFFAVLGNHDYYGNEQAQIDYSASNSRWVMPARFHEQKIALPAGDTIQAIGLDTNLLLSHTDTTTQLLWMDSVLTAGKYQYRVVYAHHPLYSGGEHGGSGELQRQLESRFSKAGVLVYLAGHDHHLEVIQPGTGTTTWHLVSGAGGKSRSVTWTDRTLFAHTNLGFMQLNFTASRCWVSVFDADGNHLYSQILR